MRICPLGGSYPFSSSLSLSSLSCVIFIYLISNLNALFPPNPLTRAGRRNVRSAQRDMDREMRELDRTETQVLTEIKSRAKQSGVAGNDPALN